jgi:hypothetical protein
MVVLQNTVYLNILIICFVKRNIFVFVFGHKISNLVRTGKHYCFPEFKLAYFCHEHFMIFSLCVFYPFLLTYLILYYLGCKFANEDCGGG